MKARRKYVYWIVALVFVFSISLSFRSMGQIERIPGLPPITDVMQKGLDHVLPFDREKMARLDVSAEQAAKMRTSDLFYQAILNRLTAVYKISEDEMMGIYRASRCSPSLAELIRRDDIADGFINGCKKAEESQNENDPAIGGRTSLGLMILCDLAQYPPIFDKFKGQEKTVLSCVCDQYHKKRKIGFSGTLHSVYGLALKLAKKLDPNVIEVRAVKGDNAQSITKKMDEFMKSLERLYKG